ncbi:hypothetical protein CSC3H3_14485 [Thalassospira marina]|uniref:4Fe-4S ferredoxin-type domain-containing protein n=1 Tax=Thalassospira marina TaxID=2048283 RepID=A0ABM6QBA5_9PROT|nr:hypothetical protein CSC3H3_14485 [Thalassospira marina]
MGFDGADCVICGQFCPFSAFFPGDKMGVKGAISVCFCLLTHEIPNLTMPAHQGLVFSAQWSLMG